MTTQPAARPPDAGAVLLFRLASTALNAVQERFIRWVNTHDDVHWVPMIEMANEHRSKCPPAADAKMPKGFKAS